MRLTYTLTYTDFRALNWALLAYRNYDRSVHLRNILGSWLVLLLAVLVFRYFSPPDLLPESSDFLITAVLASMIATAIIYLLISYANWVATAKLAYEQQSPFRSYTYKFSADGLHISSADGTAELQWSNFAACSANDAYLFILNNGMFGYVFPRSAFSRDSDFNAAVRLAKEKIHG